MAIIGFVLLICTWVSQYELLKQVIVNAHHIAQLNTHWGFCGGALLIATCTRSADTRAVRCKSLQWQSGGVEMGRGGWRRVEDTGYSPASSLHASTQQSRHTAGEQEDRAPSQGNKGTHGSSRRRQMNKWFIETSSAYRKKPFIASVLTSKVREIAPGK